MGFCLLLAELLSLYALFGTHGQQSFAMCLVLVLSTAYGFWAYTPTKKLRMNGCLLLNADEGLQHQPATARRAG